VLQVRNIGKKKKLIIIFSFTAAVVSDDGGWGFLFSTRPTFHGLYQNIQTMPPKLVDPPLPSLECRKQAAAVGLACKLLDGKGCVLLNELKPVFYHTQPPPAKESMHRHPHQLQHAPICHRAGLRSLETYKRSLRVRLPGTWNNLNHDVL